MQENTQRNLQNIFFLTRACIIIEQTCFAREFLPREAQCSVFVNADLIAAGLSPFAPEVAAIKAGRIMREKKIRRLPVVDKDGRLVGVVSLGDLSTRVKEKYAGETLESISR